MFAWKMFGKSEILCERMRYTFEKIVMAEATEKVKSCSSTTKIILSLIPYYGPQTW